LDVQLFSSNFALFADAPKAVKKLRELILQLAVQGRLVPQNRLEEPASKLAEKIEAEKIRSKEHGLNTLLTVRVDDEDVPYLLPNGWMWSRLANVGLINPRNNFDDNNLASFVPMNLVPQKYGDPVKTETRYWGEIRKGFTHFAENDVVLAKITPCFQNGKAAVMRGLENRIGAGTTELHVFRPIDGFILPEYVLIYLKSPEFLSNGIPRMTGTAGQKRVPSDYFAYSPFPLPPLEEQKRIVHKVDQLMRLCQELEQRQQAKCESRVCLNNVMLAPLKKAALLPPEEFKQATTKLIDNFDTLYDSVDTVVKLRSTVLQLAIQGKLVPQDPSDQSSQELLKRIQSEIVEQQTAGVYKSSPSLPPISKAEQPFPLPLGWQWSRLRSLVFTLGDGLHGTPKYSKETDCYFINGNNFAEGRIIIKPHTKTVALAEIQKHTKRMTSNTVLVSINGTLGNVAFYNDENIVLGKSACYFNLASLVDKHFVGRVIESPYFIDYATAHSTGTTIRNLGLKAMNHFPVPLPPLEEQRRIVAKVNQLMALCDDLETKLRQAEADSEKLLNAAVGYVLRAVTSVDRGRG
jgi:type I restriction enzyme S subunit